MSRRPPTRPACVLGAAVVVVSLLAGASGCASAPDRPSAPSADVGTRLDAPVSRRILSLPLRDSQGHAHTLADFAGKVLVISDAMTLCQESCPVDTSAVTQTAREVTRAGLGRRVQFLSITVDPQRDTPRRLAAYRQLFSPVPADWMALTGSPRVVGRLWTYFGVYTERVPEPRPPATDWLTGRALTYDVAHSDEVFFLSGSGRERFILEGIPDLPERGQVPGRLYRFMDAKGHHNVTHPDGTAWTVPQALQVIGWLLGRRVV